MKTTQKVSHWAIFIVMLIIATINVSYAQFPPAQYRHDCQEIHDADIWYQYYLNNGITSLSAVQPDQVLVENEFYSLSVDWFVSDGSSILSAIRLTPKNNVLLWNHYYPSWGLNNDILDSLNDFIHYSNQNSVPLIDVDCFSHPSDYSTIYGLSSEFGFTTSPIPMLDGSLLYLERQVYNSTPNDFAVTSSYAVFPDSGKLEDVMRNDYIEYGLKIEPTKRIDSKEYIVNKEIEAAGLIIEKLRVVTTPIACYQDVIFSTVDNRYTDYQLFGIIEQDNYDYDPYLIIRLYSNWSSLFPNALPRYFPSARQKLGNNTYCYKFVGMPNNPNDELPYEYEVVVFSIDEQKAYEQHIEVQTKDTPRYLADMLK